MVTPKGAKYGGNESFPTRQKPWGNVDLFVFFASACLSDFPASSSYEAYLQRNIEILADFRTLGLGSLGMVRTAKR